MTQNIGDGPFVPLSYHDLGQLETKVSPLVQKAQNIQQKALSGSCSKEQAGKLFAQELTGTESLWRALEVLGLNHREDRSQLADYLQFDNIEIVSLLSELLPAASQHNVEMPPSSEGKIAHPEQIALFAHRLLPSLNPKTHSPEIQNIKQLLECVHPNDPIANLNQICAAASTFGIPLDDTERLVREYATEPSADRAEKLMPLIRQVAKAVGYSDGREHFKSMEWLEQMFDEEGLGSVAQVIRFQSQAFLEETQRIRDSNTELKDPQVVSTLQAAEGLREMLAAEGEDASIEEVVSTANSRLAGAGFKEGQISEFNPVEGADGQYEMRLNLSTGAAGAYKGFWTSINMNSLQERGTLRFNFAKYYDKHFERSKQTWINRHLSEEKAVEMASKDAQRALDKARSIIPLETEVWKELLDRSVSNIPKLYEVVVDAKGIVLEVENFRGGDCYAWIKKEQVNNELFMLAMDGLLTYMTSAHTQKDGPFVHRDLKPGNLLVQTEEGRPSNIVVSDFGYLRQIKKGEVSVAGAVGSRPYAPPEVFNVQQSTPASDIWSAAATLFTIRYGQFYAAWRYDSSFPPSSLENIAEHMKKLIGKDTLDAFDMKLAEMLQTEPEKRPSIGEIFAWWKEQQSGD